MEEVIKKVVDKTILEIAIELHYKDYYMKIMGDRIAALEEQLDGKE